MKRTTFALATIVVVLSIVSVVLLVHPMRTVKAHPGCSDRTLTGNYAWAEFGYQPEDIPPDFWATTALVNFNGQGSFTASAGYEVDNAVYDATNVSFDGSYTVHSNCTVTLTYTYDAHPFESYGVIVGPDAAEITGVDGGYETTGQMDLKKVTYPEER